MVKRLEFVHFSPRAKSEDGITGGAGKEEWEGKEERKELDETTKGEEALADKGRSFKEAD